MSDLVVTADRVHVGRPWVPVEALLMRDGYVVAAGTRAEVAAAAVRPRRWDLPGATVLPGFVESHVHPVQVGLTEQWVDCRTPPCADIPAVVRTLRAGAAVDAGAGVGGAAGADGWLRGWGYDDTLLAEDRHLTRHDLDEVSVQVPIAVSHLSMHFVAVNTAGLRRLGLRGIDAPDGFLRDEYGDLTGLAGGMSAVQRVLDALPAPDPVQLRAALGRGLRLAARRGATTVHDLAVGLAVGAEELAAYRGAADVLPVRVVGYLRGDLALADPSLAPSGGPADRFWLRGAKLWSDGSIQGLSAALLAPYACAPGVRGELLHDPAELADRVRRLAGGGWQVAVHANGDAALRASLDALAAAPYRCPADAAGHRVEHGQVSAPEDLRRLRDLGLGVSFFVNHVRYWGDRHRDRFLGPQRAASLDAAGTARRLGLRFGLHSDCPVTPLDPLRTLATAVTRRTSSGAVLGPSERLDVGAALDALTVDAAWLAGQDGVVGTLRPGAAADLVAVSADPFGVDPDELDSLRVQATVVGGRLVAEGE